MTKEQYVIKLNPGVMKAFLLNLCAHDVIHDFNKDSTKRLVSLKEKLIKSLHFTLLYSIDDRHETILNSILAIYTPARPIHIVKSKEEIKNYVDSVPKSKK